MIPTRGTEPVVVEFLTTRGHSLVKPYDVRELQARLRAIMRRHVEGTEGHSLRFEELELDADAHAAKIGDRSIESTRTEHQLLELLMLNPRRVLTSELI